MKPPRRKLSDILDGTSGDAFRSRWATTQPAPEFGPVPSGVYTCRILSGELSQSRKGTAGYKLTFEITDGECKGRRAWHDLWLTEAAAAQTMRDLAKLQITDFEQLERPFPPGILVRVKLALHRSDSGNEFNRVVRFEVIGVEPPEPFAPSNPPADGGPQQ